MCVSPSERQTSDLDLFDSPLGDGFLGRTCLQEATVHGASGPSDGSAAVPCMIKSETRGK